MATFYASPTRVYGVTREESHNDTTVYRPGICIDGEQGPTTHWAPDSLLFHSRDAREIANNWAHEYGESNPLATWVPMAPSQLA